MGERKRKRERGTERERERDEKGADSKGMQETQPKTILLFAHRTKSNIFTKLDYHKDTQWQLARQRNKQTSYVQITRPASANIRIRMDF